MFDSPIIRPAETQTAIKNLGSNKKVEWLIRLIPYNPNTQGYLSISELKALGPPQTKYIFVASYDEVRGHKVSEAVTRVGGTAGPEDRVSAIIFRVRHIYPANARGVLQVIQKLETSVVPGEEKRLIDRGTFSSTEQQNLKEDDAISSWAWDSYYPYYNHFCEVAQTFRCDETYKAHEYIGQINSDWHPVGYARQKKVNACEHKSEVCKYKDKDWTKVANDINGDFGARVFLTDNVELKNLGARYLIEFDKPSSQVIPEIAAASN